MPDNATGGSLAARSAKQIACGPRQSPPRCAPQLDWPNTKIPGDKDAARTQRFLAGRCVSARWLLSRPDRNGTPCGKHRDHEAVSNVVRLWPGPATGRERGTAVYQWSLQSRDPAQLLEWASCSRDFGIVTPIQIDVICAGAGGDNDSSLATVRVDGDARAALLKAIELSIATGRAVYAQF